MTSRPETKQESKQHAKVGLNPATQPAKCSASNSLRVKAANKKSPTIATPVIIASLTLLCMPTRPDGAGEQDKSLTPDHMAAWSSSLAGSIEGIALAKPSLGTQTTTQALESKSSFQQGASVQDPEEEPLKGNSNASNPVQETPNTMNEGAEQGERHLRYVW